MSEVSPPDPVSGHPELDDDTTDVEPVAGDPEATDGRASGTGDVPEDGDGSGDRDASGDGALLGLELEEVDAVEGDRAADVVAVASDEHVGERALARTVRSHDRVHLARRDGQVDALEDRLVLVFQLDVQIADFQHIVSSRARPQPTLPSREMATRLCASIANSIGSACSTSRQKPLTTSATASSSPTPRARQ